MRALCVVILGLITMGLGSTQATLQAQDKVIGAIWEVWFKDPKTGKYQNAGFYRCTIDGKVYRDGKVIGSHKNTNLDNVEITITDLPKAQNNGVLKATKVTKAGTAWEGVHTIKSGAEIPIRMRLKAD